MDVLVRNAVVSDTPAILELLCELGRPAPKDTEDAAAFAGTISHYIRDADKRMLVACMCDGRGGGRDGAAVGLASVILLARCNRRGPELYVPDLVIRPEYRGRGIGRILVDACTGIARETHCHRIRLESGNRREDSHAFYRHLGFEQTALSFELLQDSWIDAAVRES